MSSKFIPNLSVTDGFDFVKNIWGSLPITSVMSSTTDVDELDKRIADLKAVEQWLNVNMSMLRATIQGLEVQRATIATIKSFGENLTAASTKGERSELDEAALREAVNRVMGQAPAEPSVSAPKPESTAPLTSEGSPVGSKSKAQKKSAVDEAEESSKALIANAAAWWVLLQDQLNKVAAAAISGSGLANEEVKAPSTKKDTARVRNKANSPSPRKTTTKTSASKQKSPGSHS
jgi:hypothetical protein